MNKKQIEILIIVILAILAIGLLLWYFIAKSHNTVSAKTYSCNKDNKCVSDVKGKYKTSNCDNACGKTPAPTQQKYSCNNDNQCVSDAKGKYTTSTCNNECGKTPAPIQQKYSCNNDNQCVSDANGKYTTSTCNNECGKKISAEEKLCSILQMDRQTPCTTKNIVKELGSDIWHSFSSIKKHCPTATFAGLLAAPSRLQYLEQHCNVLALNEENENYHY
jgi:uncharacterized protein (UPF0333 family)